jgi:hypothetical protein
VLRWCIPPGAGGTLGAFATEDGPCVALVVATAVSELVRGLFLRDGGAGCGGWAPAGTGVVVAPTVWLVVMH